MTEQNTLNEIQSRIAESRFTIRQYVIVLVCMLINVVDGYDIAAIAMAAPRLADAWHIPPETLGYVLSGEVLGMTVGALFLSAICDRYGRRRVLIPSILLVTVATGLTAFTSSLGELIVARIATGVGIGGVMTAVATLAAEFSPVKYRAAVVTFVGSGAVLGGLLGGTVSVWTLEHADWPSIFLIGGAMGAVLLVLAGLLLPESLEFLAQQRGNEKARLRAINRTLQRLRLAPLHELRSPVEIEQTSLARAFRELIGSDLRSRTFTLWSIAFCLFWVSYSMTKWLPKLLIDDGFESSDAVYALSVVFVGGAVGSLLNSYLTTRFEVARVVACMMLLSGVALGGIILLQPETVDVLYPIVFVFGLGSGSATVACYSLPILAYPTHLRAFGFGCTIGIGRIAAIAAPVVAGYLVGSGWSTAGVLGFQVLPAALIAVALLRRLR